MRQDEFKKPRNIGNELEVKNQKQKIESRERKFERDLAFILSTKEGMNVMARLVEWAGIYKQTYTGQANDTNFNEGRRSMGLQLLQYIAKINTNYFSDLHRLSSQNEQE